MAPPQVAVRSREAVAAAAMAAGGFLAGIVVAFLGVEAGPAAMAVLPALLLASVLVLRDVGLAPCLLVAAFPFGLLAVPGGFDLIQLVAAGAVGLVFLARLAHARAPLGWSRPLWWCVAVLAVAVASTFGAPDPPRAVRQVLLLVLGLFTTSAVIAAVRNEAAVRRVIQVLLFVGALACAYGLQSAGNLEAVNSGQTVNNRVQGTFTEPNQFGSFSAMVLVLAVALFFAGRSRRERLGALVAALIGLSALGLSLSRGAWIGTIVAVLLFVWLVPGVRMRLLALAVPVVLIGLTLATVAPDRPEVQVVQARVSTFGDVEGNPYDNRPAIWAEGRREVLERPVLGWGPGQFPVVSIRAASGAQTVSAQHAHNVLLTVSAEIGLLGAALLVGFTLHLLARLRRGVARASTRSAGTLLAGIGCAPAVIVGQGLVDFELRNAVIFTMLAVLVGLLLVSSPGRPRRPA